MTDNTMGGNDSDGTLVQVHEHIDKEGVIVELRPDEHDAPAERDMQHLSESEARDLHDQLGQYLAERCDDCGGHLDDDGLCPHCFDYDSV